jgi:2-succinyl-5-enolpyruvyl-6-hydroxy-3-cyclohexene-1-carboxylate synthase
VALDPEGAGQEPSAALSDSLALDPGQALSALEAGLAAPARQATPTEGAREWLERWRAADERAAEALRALLGAGALSEPRAAAELGARLPGSSTLFVASSMPVRDIESFWPAREDPPRVLCNRGANGIDGTVSSAFGAAAAGARVVLMIGDVALAHDIGGLAAARRLGLALTIVLLNNGGGGIFDFLPIAAAPMGRLAEPGRPPGGEDIYERHIATPPKLDFSLAARIYGFAHAAVTEVDELLGALERGLQSGGSQIIEVRCERAENVALHREAWRAVSSAINSTAPAAARPA